MKPFAVAVLAALLSTTPARSQDWARKALEKSTRHGEWVRVQSGGRPLHAFVVYPEVRKKAPVIVVVHEIFGLTDWARSAADALAAEGYIAVAPDMLSGLAPGGGKTSDFPDVDAARAAMATLDPAAVMRDLDAAADYAKALPASDGRVSAIGFCWGGGQAFRYAAHRPDLRAAFVFYGPSAPDVAPIKAPVYGFYAENDARINASLPDVEKAMKAAGKRFEPVTYAGGGHGFMRGGQDPDGRPGDKKARAQALKRLKNLLRK
ncbi:MAG: Dienelactone hydrolase and related enzyme (Modular protein) [Elusimicrobia bacterium]|nr:MAG: Dienelactone hydrolase and related enzyme (Modular protein) [Elusimicrobiota bacterium]